MAQFDVVARLQLRAEQFSSETGARFAEMKTRARSAAQEVRSSFAGAFAETQKLAAQALVMPRTAGGSLDLSAEIAALKAAAIESDRHAQGLREMAIAQTQAAASGRVDAEAMKLQADASAVGALAAERQAAATRERVDALQAVQAELSRTTSMTGESAAQIEAAARAEAQLVQRTEQLLNSLDPVRQAQQRFNAEVQEAQSLLDAGRITTEQYAQAQERATASLRGVADAAGLASEKQAALWRDQAAAARAEVSGRSTMTAIGQWDGSSRSGKSARDSAEVFEEAARGQRELAASAGTLRAALDPMYAAQQRFDAELDRADALHRAGTISLREYGQAQQAARDTLHAHAQAVAGALSPEQRLNEERRRSTANAGLQRQAMQQLSYQLNDVATQYASGTNVSQIFAQQSGQVFQALGLLAASAGTAGKSVDAAADASSDAGADVQGLGDQVVGVAEKAEGMGGKLGAVAGFLSGPWGAAVIAGAAILTPMLIGLVGSNDALEEAVTKLKADATATDVARGAKIQFAASIEGVTAALHDQDEALRATAASERSAAERANILAKANRDKALSIRQSTAATLADALAQERALRVAALGQQRYGRGDSASIAAELASGRVTALQAELDAAEAKAVAAERQVNVTRVDLAAEQAAIAIDPVRKVTAEYDAQIKLLKDQQREQARLGRQIGSASEDRLKALQREKKAAVEAAQERQNATKQKPVREFGREVSSSEAAAIARAAGLQVNSADRSTARQTQLYSAWVSAGRPKDNPVAKPGTSAHERGNGLDIQMSAGVTVQKIKDAFASEGVKLTKVFAERGHWHVEWQKSGAMRQGEADAAKAAREAAAEARELDSALDAVRKQFDPAGAAAHDFAEALDQIAKLKAAGKLTSSQADDYAYTAMLQENARRAEAVAKRGREVLGIDGDPLGGVIDAYDRNRGDPGAEWDKEEERRQAVAEGHLRDLSDMYFDLFDNRSGNIWANFERRAMGVLADVAARETLAVILGSGTSAADQRAGTGASAAGEIRAVRSSIDQLGVKLPKGISQETAKTVVQGAGLGALGGGIFGSITGGKGNPIASAIGGVVGDVAGKALGKTFATGATGLLKSLGGAAGPLGAIAGGVLGSLVGGMFRSVPKASAGISVSNGSISAGKASGSGDATSTAATLAGSVAQGLQQIADQLGAAITGATDVKIGTYDGKWRVNATGGAIGGVKGSGALSFETQEQAVAFAIADALKDGVLSGVSAASQVILQSGQNLTASIGKVQLIEAIPKDLKAMLDPVGAAVDELNRKFAKTVAALNEGGASAEQMAQAQRLYDMQLAQVRASTASASAGLKDFLTSLKLGSDSPLSLRDQEAAALAQLKPYLAQIDAGQAVDQSKYQDAAKKYLDVERAIYGSTQGFFDAFDAVQASTAKAIATIDNASPITASVESPFAKATADSTAATAAAAQANAEIAAQNTELLMRMTSALETIAAGGGGDSTFIGAARAYLAVA